VTDRTEVRIFSAIVMLGAGLGTMSGAAGLSIKGQLGAAAFGGGCACALAMVFASCWLLGTGLRRAYAAGIGVGLASALYGWFASGQEFLWAFPLVHAATAACGLALDKARTSDDRETYRAG